MKARTMIALMALLAALVAFDLPAFSTAAFTSKSTNTGTVRAAADWTPPTVSLVNPGSPVKDTVTITANASDAETGIASVTIQSLAAGGSSWVSLCTDTTAPYSCPWNTKSGTVPDGGYTLRAIATDNSGYSTTSDLVTTTVANNFMVTLSNPGEFVRGSVNLTATLVNGGLINLSSVRIEYALSGTTTWRTLCTPPMAPYTCTWNTTGFANDYYDLRAVALSGLTSTYSAVHTDVLVDNVAPAVTMTDPGTPLSGFRTFASTATDASSGVAAVTIQYSAGSSWNTLCTVTAPPFSCRYNTALLLDGTYSFRAVAVDAAGNSTTSNAVAGRIIDNTVSSVSLEDPGAFLTGTVPLTANAASTAGVTSVRIQSAPAGTATWTTLCTLAAAPYTCNWDTTKTVNGPYDFRAVMVDGTTKETVSAVITARQVDNMPLRGYDIQGTNGSASAGRLEAGDVLTYTYSQQVNLTTITPGWNGAPLAVTARAADSATGDTIDILRTSSFVNLGLVNLRQDFIRVGKTVNFSATMTASTVTVNGTVRTVVTVTLGAPTQGSGLRNVTAAGALIWTPNGAVTDLLGNRTSTAPVTESGALDRDF